MTKNINVELSDEEFENLKEVKNRTGLTWRAFLLWGATKVKEIKLEEAEDD